MKKKTPSPPPLLFSSFFLFCYVSLFSSSFFSFSTLLSSFASSLFLSFLISGDFLLIHTLCFQSMILHSHLLIPLLFLLHHNHLFLFILLAPITPHSSFGFFSLCYYSPTTVLPAFSSFIPFASKPVKYQHFQPFQDICSWILPISTLLHFQNYSAFSHFCALFTI